MFENLPRARAMVCRFCSHSHTWEVVEQAPDVYALMSLRAEDFLGRAIQNDAYAAQIADPAVRNLYTRIAEQWYALAAENEAKADALR